MVEYGYLPSRVFEFTRPRERRNIYATKGKSQYSGPLLGKGSWQGDESKKTLQFPINTDDAKETFFNRLNKIDPPQPGADAATFRRTTSLITLSGSPTKRKRQKWQRVG